jgi:LmbE family N-acetylglucosaminyl deacetylase
VHVYDSVEAIAKRYRHVYLEPHFDDVALSCGGTLAAQSARGESALVVTIFAAEPTEATPETTFVVEHHAKWGGSEDPIGERRREQVEALDLLGADWLALPYLDAIYRGGQYLSDDDLFGRVKPGDGPLVAQLGATLAALAARVAIAETRWYVPLAIGNHVDHQLALIASASLAERWGYEDFPYAAKAGAAPSESIGAQPGASVPIGPWLERKIDAIARYRTQVPVLFGDEQRMREAVRAFALRRGGGSPAEQLWRLRGGAPDALLDS